MIVVMAKADFRASRLSGMGVVRISNSNPRHLFVRLIALKSKMLKTAGKVLITFLSD